MVECQVCTGLALSVSGEPVLHSSCMPWENLVFSLLNSLLPDASILLASDCHQCAPQELLFFNIITERWGGHVRAESL